VSTDLGPEIRRAFEEIADLPPPGDLADRAVRLARKRHRRVVACAALVVLVAVGVPLAVRGTDELPLPSANWSYPPLPSEPQVVAAAYADVEGGSYVLDREAGRYRKVPWRLALPSPDGERFFVADGRRGGVVDDAGGAVRWVGAYDSYTSVVAWSPDGSRILLSQAGKGDPAGFVLVDADTLVAGPLVEVPDLIHVNAMGLGFFWARDGRSVGLTLSAAGGETNPDRVIGVRFYDLGGQPLRTLGITGYAAIRDGADVSPDGKRAAAAVRRDGPGIVQVFDLGDGSVVEEFTAGDVVGWYDNDHLVVRDGDASLAVVDASGQAVKRVSGTVEAQAVHLVAVEGRSPPPFAF